MGQFEEKSVSKTALPTDIPSAKEAAAQHPDGAIYRANDGKRFRLRHPRWVPVTERKKKANAKAK